MNEASFEHFFNIIEPKLHSYHELKRNHRFLQALLQLNVQNDDEFDLLSEDYKNLLHNKQKIEANYEIESKNLARLVRILTEFYMDKNKFKGVNVRNLDVFLNALNNYKKDTLKEFFCASSPNDSKEEK